MGTDTLSPPLEHGNCPNCEVSLDGESIWETFYRKSREDGYYKDKEPMNHKDAIKQADKISSYYGASKTKGRWGRKISIYDLEHDKIVAHKCPNCDHQWSR